MVNLFPAVMGKCVFFPGSISVWFLACLDLPYFFSLLHKRQKKTHISLHFNYLLFLLNCKKNWIIPNEFSKNSQISWKSVQCSPCYSKRKVVRTVKTNLKFAFRKVDKFFFNNAITNVAISVLPSVTKTAECSRWPALFTKVFPNIQCLIIWKTGQK